MKEKLGLTQLGDRELLMKVLLDIGHLLTEKQREHGAALLAGLESGVMDRLARGLRDKFFAIGRAHGLFERPRPKRLPSGGVAIGRDRRAKTAGELAVLAAMRDKDKWLPKRPPGKPV